MTLYIGLDPGTAMGWAVLNAEGKRLASGEWDLSTNRFEGGGMRYVKCQSALRKLIAAYDANDLAVGIEEVRFIKQTDSAQVYGGILAACHIVCEELEIPYQGRPVKAVKKFATGTGNAGKPMMVAAAKKRWGHADTDNEADALWVAESLRQELT